MIKLSTLTENYSKFIFKFKNWKKLSLWKIVCAHFLVMVGEGSDIHLLGPCRVGSESSNPEIKVRLEINC